MDLDYSEEQVLLQDAVRRLLGDRLPFEARRAAAADPRGWSVELWRELAELGFLAATFPEADGGLGGGAVEAMILAEALGGALAAEPYLSTVVMGGTALSLSDNAALRTEVLPKVAAGELIVACALGGEVRAMPQGGAWRLEGVARNVAQGHAADRLVVACEGLVVLVDAGAPGVARRPHRTFDGGRAAELRFSGARIEAGAVLAQGAAAEALVERVTQGAIAALAAETVGISAMALDATVEHLKTRTQFGQPLAKFQALQHRAVEMLVALEQARSMALYAATMTEAADAAERRKAFAAVKAVIGRAGRFVGQNAVQLHGGVGVTEEHRVGWALKRLTLIEMLFGDSEAQTAKLAALGGFVDAA